MFQLRSMVQKEEKKWEKLKIAESKKWKTTKKKLQHINNKQTAERMKIKKMFHFWRRAESMGQMELFPAHFFSGSHDGFSTRATCARLGSINRSSYSLTLNQCEINCASRRWNAQCEQCSQWWEHSHRWAHELARDCEHANEASSHTQQTQRCVRFQRIFDPRQPRLRS